MTSRPTLEQQLEQLRRARSELASAAAEARGLAADLHPKTMVTRAVKRHPWRWALGGGIAGWVLLRLIIPGKSRWGSKKSFTKGSLLGMIVASAGGLLRVPAEEYMRRRVRAMFEEMPNGEPTDGPPRNSGQPQHPAASSPRSDRHSF